MNVTKPSNLFYCDITDRGLKRITKSCKHLKEVNLRCCVKITSSGLQSVIQGCQLRTLDVSVCCKITDIGFQGGSPTLEEVIIADCDKITDSGIRFLIQGCPQLRTLNISGCCKITGIGFQGCSPTLACVKADKCVLSSTGIAEMLSGGGLEYLSLASIKCIEGNGLATIGLGLAPNLKVLDFYKCEFVTDEVILSISQVCPLLQEWNLYCGHISTSGYDPIGLYCQNLKRVHLNGCYSFHHEACLALVNGCKRLSVIRMKNCSQVVLSVIWGTLRDDLKIIKREARRTVPSWVFTDKC